jgi:hypothetical protein
VKHRICEIGVMKKRFDEFTVAIMIEDIDMAVVVSIIFYLCASCRNPTLRPDGMAVAATNDFLSTHNPIHRVS